MPPPRIACGCGWKAPSLLILLVTTGRAVRDESFSTNIDVDKSGGSAKNSAWTNSSLLATSHTKSAAEQVPGGALAVSVAEQALLKAVEVQARMRAQAMVCADHIVVPPGPIELKPDWLYGVGCALDHGHMCRCPWRVFFGCQRTGMFGLPGGVTTDIVQKMGFCRIEPWIFIIPPVLLIGAAIVFMPSSSRSSSTGEDPSQPRWMKGVDDEVKESKRRSKSETSEDDD
ncbi:yfiL [Symbiodinium sp. KB8]|nr:yfiL [Symbiodinium sp. KB8]